MNTNVAIEFTHVGKQYRLGRVGTGTVSHDLNRWWQTSILKKEDPYLKIGEVNDRTIRGKSDYIWALRDVSLQVERGDVLGIIGMNGAGKSTMLKLLSHITSPSTGKISHRGRIASLLEVGTGFHSEMTARENIFMNGSIMGMSRREIQKKLDEIVEFAGVERYLDTPVKRFSSGMTVRLGFAVAAFLEPEILVVDEVLAVGDAEFQKKALGKMKDVSSHGGRTVLFVSHNMDAVNALCKHGVVLKNGMIDHVGEADDCVNYYMTNNIQELRDHCFPTPSMHSDRASHELEYTEIRMLNDVRNVSTEEVLVFEMKIRRNNRSIRRTQVGTVVKGPDDKIVWANYSKMLDLPDNRDNFKVRVEIPNHNTVKGKYQVNFNLCVNDSSSVVWDYDVVFKAISFEVKYLDQRHTLPFIMWPFQGGTYVRNERLTLLDDEI